MAPTPVFLPGESPWTEEPGGQQSMGSQRVRHDWSDLTHTHIPQSRVSFSVRWLSFLIAISWDLWLVKGLWKHWHTTQKLGFKSFIFGGGLASKLYPTLATVALPGSSVHGVFQARILEWIAISFSRGSSWPRDWTWVSGTAGRFFTDWTTRAFPSLIFRSPEMAHESTTRVVIYNCLCQINCLWLLVS